MCIRDRLLEEIDIGLCVRKPEQELAKKAIPCTIQLLRAGRPFPEWNDWWEMR